MGLLVKTAAYTADVHRRVMMEYLASTSARGGRACGFMDTHIFNLNWSV